GALAAYERVASLAPERRAEEVLLRLMREVGDLWEHGAAAVAQEHFATAFVREKLAEMIGRLDTAAAAGPEAVCAGLPGERHELGLMGAALRLAGAGWRVTYLGLEVPFEEVARVVRERRPALLCTSLLHRMNAADFREMAAALRATAPRRTAVVIGGTGVPAFDGAPLDGVRVAACFGELFSAN
ncbi:MAG TPA: cobalamin-dependent protein, partial [Longimicrobium sp.]|nr:cobalamin-dependent protein [Longimicrobium sp.]